MRKDADIKKDVQDELSWDPSVDETKIGVAVDKGVVTLTGEVDSYAKKMAAEKAVKRVYGVKAVVENIVTRYPTSMTKTDTEIAKAALNALKWHSSVPEDTIMVKVENGIIYLSGEVKWNFQKLSAYRAVRDLVGIKGVTNAISIKKGVQPVEVKRKIKDAFERSAVLDAEGITISVDGDLVTLSGKVKSIKEKEDAQKAASNAPGVSRVQNNLHVDYTPAYA